MQIFYFYFIQFHGRIQINEITEENTFGYIDILIQEAPGGQHETLSCYLNENRFSILELELDY